MPGLANAFALIMGPQKPYNPDAEAARAYTIEGFGFSETITAGDYARYFTNESFRNERWAGHALQAIGERMERTKADADTYLAACNEDQAQTLKQTYDDWARKHLAESLADVRSTSSLASPMVTGPSNFPIARMEKRRNAKRRREEGLTQAGEQITKRLKKIVYPYGAPGEGIRSNDPDAIKQLERKLEDRRYHQEEAKQQNAAARKAKQPRPVPTWWLSNNNAQIKRIAGRIDELKAMAQRTQAEPATVETAAGGFEIIENAEMARIQIIFPGKPDADTRAILKGKGFRWAPSQGAWQRHLNANGIYAAQRVTAALTAA